MEHSLGMPFEDNLNLMHIFNHEESTGATCFRPIAGIWLTNGKGNKEAITSILMTTGLFCGCKLHPHLSSDQVDEEKMHLTRGPSLSNSSNSAENVLLFFLQTYSLHEENVSIIHIKFTVLTPQQAFLRLFRQPR